MKDFKVYYSDESYNEKQEIESITLRTSSLLTELISFHAFSTVCRYIIL